MTTHLTVADVLRRDWDVAVLDAWVTDCPGREWNTDNVGFGGSASFFIRLDDEHGDAEDWSGSTPAEARQAAAAHTFERLRNEVRERLGARP